MTLRSGLRALCILAAVACLAMAYTLVGEVFILLVVPAVIAFWLLAGRRSGFGRASGLLAIYLALDAIAVVRHAPGLLATTGCVFALVGWDLSDPRGEPTQAAAGQRSNALEGPHLRSLAVTATLSLALTVVASRLQLRLPFGVMAALAIVATGCTLYGVHRLRHPAEPRRD